LKQMTADLEKDIRRLDELFLSGLEECSGPFLAGDKFTAVDAFFCPVAFRVRTYNLPLNRKSSDYVEKLLALPSMQEWEKRALEEQERDAIEEAELDRYANREEDRRRKS